MYLHKHMHITMNSFVELSLVIFCSNKFHALVEFLGSAYELLAIVFTFSNLFFIAFVYKRLLG